MPFKPKPKVLVPKEKFNSFKGVRKVSVAKFIEGTEAYLQKCEETRRVPFLGELAYKLGISADTMSRYAQQPSYAETIKKVKQATENGLIDRGLNDNKPVFPIFLLKARFGYVETTRQDITSNGETLGVVQLPTR